MPMQWKIMTFNIQHGFDYIKKDSINLAQVANAIRAEAPDLVLLNEVRGDGIAEDYTDQTGTLAALLGWHGYFAQAFDVPNGGPYGNAVLSPHPFTAETIPIPTPSEKGCEPRCIVRAAFETDAGAFVVFGSHFGLSMAEQQNAVQTVCRCIDAEAHPYVVMGDFNAVPQDAVLAPLFARMQDTAAVFADPDARSFPSDHPTIKIDYIFAHRSLSVKWAEILPIAVSDHRPYAAEIAW